MCRVSPLVCTVAAAVGLLTISSASANDSKNSSPFKRLEKVSSSPPLGRDLRSGVVRGLDALDPFEKLQFIEKAKKDGTNPLEMLGNLLHSNGFQLLVQNVEMQRKIVEHFPILSAFDSIKKLRGRRLDDESTTAHFTSGLEQVMEFMEQSHKNMENPTEVFKVMNDLADNGDAETKAVFAKAKQGDQASIKEVNNIVNARMFPNVDASVFQSVLDAANFDKLMSMTEIKRFLEIDPVMKQVFNSPNGDAVRNRMLTSGREL